MAKQLKYAFRMIHIDNIPHIIRYGLLRSASPDCDRNFVSIGDRQIIGIRSVRPVCGVLMSECVPFYLGPRTPMLYVIQHGYNGVTRREPWEIVYCVVRLSDISSADIDCVFSDGHALSALTKFYSKDKLCDIDNIVSRDDVYSLNWNNDTDIDLKRRKEAELLVIGDLPAEYICGYVVYDDYAKKRLTDSGISEASVIVAPHYYF